jgi:hypothetical protein
MTSYHELITVSLQLYYTKPAIAPPENAATITCIQVGEYLDDSLRSPFGCSTRRALLSGMRQKEFDARDSGLTSAAENSHLVVIPAI